MMRTATSGPGGPARRLPAVVTAGLWVVLALGADLLFRELGDHAGRHRVVMALAGWLAIAVAAGLLVALTARRRRLEEAADAQRLHTLMDALPVAIVELDPDIRVRWWNRAAADLLGWAPPSAIGIPPGLALDPGSEAGRLWERALSGTSTTGMALRLTRPDGAVRQVSVSAAPTRDSRGLTGIMALVDDVTERRLLEDQMQQADRLEAMGRLAGGVAHDFNNLISVILGYSEMLLRSAEDPGVREGIEAISRAGKRAAELTGQLLAIGRREVGVPTVIDPGAVVTEMETMVRSLLGADVDLRIDVDDGAARVLIDPSQLERILLNLVINARDAMPGGGRLSLEVAHIRPGAGRPVSPVAAASYTRIEVADTGIGMDPETARHCFDPFFTTKPRSKGTGLGLAAVHGLVTAAGGKVSVRSQPGQGTTFTILLPEVLQTEVETPAPGNQAPGSGGGELLLLVEDEDELRHLARRSLEELGYTVLTAANGTEAMEVARRAQRAPDLLVTDVIMPEMDGPTLAAGLLARDPSLGVLFVSGYLGSEAPNRARLPEGADLLAKPFGPAELGRRVAGALERAGQARARGARGPAAA